MVDSEWLYIVLQLASYFANYWVRWMAIDANYDVQLGSLQSTPE